MIHWVRFFVVLIIMAIIAIIAARFYYQHKLIYIPTKELGEYKITPAHYGSQVSDVYITTKDKVSLHGWWLPSDGNAPIIIYFHGNSDNLTISAYIVSIIRSSTNCNVFIFDYRGFGRSSPQSNPTHRGLKLDCEAVMNWVVDKQNKREISDIYAYAHSLGGGVALDYAVRHPGVFKGVILENTFISMRNISRVLIPEYRWAVPIVVSDVWKNDYAVRNINVEKILFLCSEKDEIMPPDQMKTLYEQCNVNNKRFVSIPDGSHNTDFYKHGDLICSTVKEFIGA